MRYRNVSGDHRIWPALTNSETGRTLELDDGDDAEVVEDVSDLRLEPVAAKRAKPKPEPASGPEPELSEGN